MAMAPSIRRASAASPDAPKHPPPHPPVREGESEIETTGYEPLELHPPAHPLNPTPYSFLRVLLSYSELSDTQSL